MVVDPTSQKALVKLMFATYIVNSPHFSIFTFKTARFPTFISAG